ncbi:hypothetical protein HAP94_10780 [Acidithiobacillus ferrivorans]|nr:hypothetical protein [Acidithiobacillus ferrivorans]
MASSNRGKVTQSRVLGFPAGSSSVAKASGGAPDDLDDDITDTHWQLDRAAPAGAFDTLESEMLWDKCCRETPLNPWGHWAHLKWLEKR